MRSQQSLGALRVFDQLEGRSGVLPSRWIKAAIAGNVIEAGAFTIPEENVQPASLDLRLGETAYRIRSSFLPAKDTVERSVKDFVIDPISLHNEGVVTVSPGSSPPWSRQVRGSSPSGNGCAHDR